MCPPTFFDIEYEINAWMHQTNQVSNPKSHQEWEQLVTIYQKDLGWNVQLMEPVEHLPDMVFATDCCLMLDGKMMLSNFRYPERQPETNHFKSWFEEHGYNDFQQAKNRFEGGGDALVCGDKILVGYGFRSDIESHDELRKYFDREVISLHIIDPYFYHLDTSVAVLSNDTVAFYPGALDEQSQKLLRTSIPNVIEATLEEAQGFGLNAVSDGHTIITSNENEELLRKYREHGFQTIGTPILEFRKSGGGVKCLTLELRS
ncbi:MAG: amidinotransferase [Candidatus Saccharimonadales bacterium]